MKTNIRVLSCLLMCLRIIAGTTGSEAGTGGFVSLFNGRDLTGWRVKAGLSRVWAVRDAAISCEHKGGEPGWIETEKRYGDFVLRCEWKVAEGANSGIFLRLSDAENQEPAYEAVEIQVCDDYSYSPFYHKNDPRELSGAVYGVVGASEAMYGGVDEWNTFEITCKGTLIKVVYNGKVVIDIDTRDYREPFEYWGAVRPSLYDRPGAGFIGLQSHVGSAVWFRGLAIHEIDTNATVLYHDNGRTNRHSLQKNRMDFSLLFRPDGRRLRVPGIGAAGEGSRPPGRAHGRYLYGGGALSPGRVWGIMGPVR